VFVKLHIDCASKKIFTRQSQCTIFNKTFTCYIDKVNACFYYYTGLFYIPLIPINKLLTHMLISTPFTFSNILKISQEQQFFISHMQVRLERVNIECMNTSCLFLVF